MEINFSQITLTEMLELLITPFKTLKTCYFGFLAQDNEVPSSGIMIYPLNR